MGAVAGATRLPVGLNLTSIGFHRSILAIVPCLMVGNSLRPARGQGGHAPLGDGERLLNL